MAPDARQMLLGMAAMRFEQPVRAQGAPRQGERGVHDEHAAQD